MLLLPTLYLLVDRAVKRAGGWLNRAPGVES
jgi:hypothetical protein